jgi:hypothetical protein
MMRMIARHVTLKVFPALAAIQGHRGARVLRREADFAGESCEHAVVEPEARAVLSDYDNFVRHYEVHESH